MGLLIFFGEDVVLSIGLACFFPIRDLVWCDGYLSSTAVLVLKSWVWPAPWLPPGWARWVAAVSDSYPKHPLISEMLQKVVLIPKLLIQIPFHKWNDNQKSTHGFIFEPVDFFFVGWTSMPRAVASPIHFSLHWGSCALEPSRILEWPGFAVSPRFRASLCRYDGVKKWKEYLRTRRRKKCMSAGYFVICDLWHLTCWLKLPCCVVG